MYETIKRLYQEGRLTKAQLDIAVIKHWITQGQSDKLINAT